jgi:hypothetical protein
MPTLLLILAIARRVRLSEGRFLRLSGRNSIIAIIIHQRDLTGIRFPSATDPKDFVFQ